MGDVVCVVLGGVHQDGGGGLEQERVCCVECCGYSCVGVCGALWLGFSLGGGGAEGGRWGLCAIVCLCACVGG